MDFILLRQYQVLFVTHKELLILSQCSSTHEFKQIIEVDLQEATAKYITGRTAATTRVVSSLVF